MNAEPTKAAACACEHWATDRFGRYLNYAETALAHCPGRYAPCCGVDYKPEFSERVERDLRDRICDLEIKLADRENRRLEAVTKWQSLIDETERLRAGSALGHETQASIEEWRKKTFGWRPSAAILAARANKEMAELIAALAPIAQGDSGGTAAADEVADVVIVLYGVAEQLGVNLHEQIDKKMKVNRMRDWTLDGKGNRVNKEWK